MPAHTAFPGRGITHTGMLFAGRGAENSVCRRLSGLLACPVRAFKLVPFDLNF